MERARRNEDQKFWVEAERWQHDPQIMLFRCYSALLETLDEIDQSGAEEEQLIINNTLRGISLYALCHIYYKLKQYPKAKQCYKDYLKYEQSSQNSTHKDPKPKFKMSVTPSQQSTPSSTPSTQRKNESNNNATANTSLPPSLSTSATNKLMESQVSVEETVATTMTLHETVFALKTQLGLAKVYRKEGKLSKAELLCKGITNRPAFDDHGDREEESVLVDKARHLLCKIYEAQGKYYESETLYKRRWEDLCYRFQEMEKTAEVNIKNQKYQEAQQLFKNALSLKEAALPVLEKLTDLYISHNKYNEAKTTVKQCAELKEKLKDPEHYSLAETYCILGEICKLQNNPEEAMTIYTKCLKISEKALSSNENLIASLKKQNMKLEIDKTTQRNLDIKRVLLLTLQHLVDLLHDQHKHAEAAPYVKKIQEVAASMQHMPSLDSSADRK